MSDMEYGNLGKLTISPCGEAYPDDALLVIDYGNGTIGTLARFYRYYVDERVKAEADRIVHAARNFEPVLEALQDAEYSIRAATNWNMQGFAPNKDLKRNQNYMNVRKALEGVGIPQEPFQEVKP